METVSEIPAPGRKSGRPSVFDESDRAAIPWVSDGHSPRQIANIMYRQRALFLLMKLERPERFDWLFKAGGGKERGKTRCWRPTILAELGRLSNDSEVIEAFALRLCEVKPTTAEAVEMLRDIRLTKRGTERRPRKPLADHILEAINHYRRRHPSTADSEVIAALQEAAAAFETPPDDDGESMLQ